MAMNMRRAFNAQMLVPLTLLSTTEGYFDEFNNWVNGVTTSTIIYGRVIKGNRFSQFDAGIAKKIEDGGQRYADYRSLYIKDDYDIKITDQITSATYLKGRVFNILNETDEAIFGFRGFLIEAQEENYIPPTPPYSGSYINLVDLSSITGDPSSVGVFPDIGGSIDPNITINGADLALYTYTDNNNGVIKKSFNIGNQSFDINIPYTLTIDGTSYEMKPDRFGGYLVIDDNPALYNYLYDNSDRPIEFDIVQNVPQLTVVDAGDILGTPGEVAFIDPSQAGGVPYGSLTPEVFVGENSDNKVVYVYTSGDQVAIGFNDGTPVFGVKAYFDGTMYDITENGPNNYPDLVQLLKDSKDEGSSIPFYVVEA